MCECQEHGKNGNLLSNIVCYFRIRAINRMFILQADPFLSVSLHVGLMVLPGTPSRIPVAETKAQEFQPELWP